MKIQVQPMGPYQTNCYIISINDKDIIIDPGMDAFSWIKEHVTNPIAILNTHGHFDHVWSNTEVQEYFNIPLYTPKDDVFLLQSTEMMAGLPHSFPDYEIEGDADLELEGIQIKFRHFPGHCPGCSTIEIEDAMFSGDFIFERSIGRCDFPFSSPSDMKDSLLRFKSIEYDKTIYPGHGGPTSIKAEQANVQYWIRTL
ncbi:MBL fold metallo-hydrolase [Sulfurimonas sp. MAG313]|nr:MBL fold metallo-hydrolase [Sulfurimonas sp. MAG313]MDF1879800.1 MBL fold metallo-hydrolase [Sulfurimonas sp. MAG313]